MTPTVDSDRWTWAAALAGAAAMFAAHPPIDMAWGAWLAPAPWVALAPGGYHGMLMDLTAALKEGETFPATLMFQTAGEVTVTVDILSMRAEGPDCADAGQ